MAAPPDLVERTGLGSSRLSQMSAPLPARQIVVALQRRRLEQEPQVGSGRGDADRECTLVHAAQLARRRQNGQRLGPKTQGWRGLGLDRDEIGQIMEPRQGGPALARAQLTIDLAAIADNGARSMR